MDWVLSYTALNLYNLQEKIKYPNWGNRPQNFVLGKKKKPEISYQHKIACETFSVLAFKLIVGAAMLLVAECHQQILMSCVI